MNGKQKINGNVSDIYIGFSWAAISGNYLWINWKIKRSMLVFTVRVALFITNGKIGT